MPKINHRLTNSVVAIGKDENGVFNPSATGFFFGSVTPDPETKGNVDMLIFLITNNHVIDKLQTITIRVNDVSGAGTRIYDLPLYTKDNHRLFEVNKNIDLAVVSMGLAPWSNKEISPTLTLSSETIASLEQYKKLEVAEADDVYVLGYPMGLIGVDRNFPFVRMGIISKISDYLAGKADNIIVDSQIYPGNSGGPVFLEPKKYLGDDILPVCATGTEMTYLLGVVSGYIPYKETAYSLQTGLPRIEFQENSGLGSIIPSPFIFELINQHNAYRKSMGAKTIRHPLPGPLIS